ncbi:hypothetical protein ABEF93_001967 [Exophiala dermatitidis]
MGLASKLAAANAAYPGGPPTSLQPGGGAPGGYGQSAGQPGGQQYQAYPEGPPSVSLPQLFPSVSTCARLLSATFGPT